MGQNKKDSGVIFRRIRGKIVPIKNKQQKTRFRGASNHQAAGNLLGGVGASAVASFKGRSLVELFAAGTLGMLAGGVIGRQIPRKRKKR